jgi:hypothetical protein
MIFTKHAIIRFAQRGMKVSDIEFYEHFGEHLSRNEMIIPDKTARNVANDLRKIADRIERLKNTKLITDESGSVVITAYRQRHSQKKKSLRRAYEGGYQLM